MTAELLLTRSDKAAGDRERADAEANPSKVVDALGGDGTKSSAFLCINRGGHIEICRVTGAKTIRIETRLGCMANALSAACQTSTGKATRNTN